jgi:polar amino acid transport system permease protein
MSFLQVTKLLLEGFGTTVLLFILTLVMSLPLGLVVSFGSMSKFKPLRWLTRGFIWIIRGTPLMLQVIIVFYVPGMLFGINFSTRMMAALIAFVINYSCYFSEIYRGGIESISKGQYEAGQVLGMTKGQIFFKIILFQVIKRITAPTSNEVITLVKDTALARVIAYGELIMASYNIVAGFGLIYPLFYAGVFYLAFCGLLTLMFGYIEKKLAYYN